MDFYAKAERLNDKDFKQIIGVEKATFDAMATILKLNNTYAEKNATISMTYFNAFYQ